MPDIPDETIYSNTHEMNLHLMETFEKGLIEPKAAFVIGCSATTEGNVTTTMAIDHSMPQETMILLLERAIRDIREATTW